MSAPMLWINVVSDQPGPVAGSPPGRKFWTMDFGTEADALDDAKDYPRETRMTGTIHYVETIEHRIGGGVNLPEAVAEDDRLYGTGEDAPVRSTHHRASWRRAA